MQRLVERQVRDLFVLTARIIAKHFTPATLARLTAVEMTPELVQMLGQPLDQYRIDVGTDSTVRADQTRNRQEMSEFLQGTASFFQVVAPLVAQAPVAAGPPHGIRCSPLV